MNLQQDEIHDRFLRKRTIRVGELTSDHIGSIQKDLWCLSLENKRREVRLIIDSVGGEATGTLDLVALIQSLPVLTTGVVIRKCMSAAVTLLQACNNRLATPFCHFHLHHLHCDSFTYDTSEPDNVIISRLQAHIRCSRALNETNASLIAKRSGKSVAQILELMTFGEKNPDSFLSATEAKELGLIDDIIESVTLPI